VIANKLGYADKKKIYAELDLRAKILQKMTEQNIVDYYKVKDIIWLSRGTVLKVFHSCLGEICSRKLLNAWK